MTINDKLATIQTKFKSKKSRFNSFGKYHFRSAEDILEATKPFLLELGVTVRINEEYIHTSIDAVAIVGIDLNQKGMNVPQQFGSASSYAKKYALGNLFLIDDTADSDATNTHGKAPKAKNTLTSKNDPAFKKAQDYIKAGGKLDAIKAKYALSKEVEAELNTL